MASISVSRTAHTVVTLVTYLLLLRLRFGEGRNADSSMDSDIRELTFQNVLDTVLKPAGVKVGGFPEEIFIDLSPEENEAWNCSICFLVVKDCRECTNKHLFCHTCIFAWSLTFGSNSQCCPVCRCEQASYADSVTINSKLADKRVNCPVDGCSFRGPLKIFLLHNHGKQNFSNGHVDLDSLRPVRRQSRLLMPAVIGLPADGGDYTNDVRAQLHQGRMVIHQMMALLQLEMQLRQRALDSFSLALDSQTRVDRLDEVLALNEQLNEVGSILTGLMQSERPRLAAALGDSSSGWSRMLAIPRQATSSPRLTLYNVMPAHAASVVNGAARTPTPFSDEPLSPPNTNSIDAALSSDESSLPSPRSPFDDEGNASSHQGVLLRMQIPVSRGVSRGTSVANLTELESTQDSASIDSSTEAAVEDRCRSITTSRESIGAREAIFTVQQSDPLTFRPELRSANLLPPTETLATRNISGSPTINTRRVRPSLTIASTSVRPRPISFSINNRSASLTPITRISSESSYERVNSASSLRNGRLPSIDTTLCDANAAGESNNVLSSDQNVAGRAVYSELAGRNSERRAGEIRRTEPRQTASIINTNRRRLIPNARNVAQSISNQHKLNEVSTPLSLCAGENSSGSTSVASTGRTAAGTAVRQAVPRTVDVSIFRQNRKPNKTKGNTTSRFPLGRTIEGATAALASTRSDTNGYQSPNSPESTTNSTHISAVRSRNLQPLRRKRPPLSIVGGTANQPPASNTLNRSRRRSEIAQDLRQMQNKLDE